MSLLLIALTVATTTNPARIASAARGDRRAVAFAAGALLVVGTILAWLSGPIIELIGISVPSAVIAAGIAVVVVGTRDAVVAPPVLETSPTPIPTAVFPVFFPTMFTPSLALMTIAGGAERGVWASLAAVFVGLVLAVVASLAVPHKPVGRPSTLARVVAGLFGLGSVVTGVFVATHGVMSI